MSPSEGRLKLTIVGGFLGTGKTTWLRHHLFDRTFPGAHVLVNEAAGTPVDHSLLAQADALTVLAGGCACCDGRQALQDALLNICDDKSKSPKTAVHQLVLETSGLADPGSIIDLIQSHPVLVRRIVVSDVIVIVDALYGLVSLETELLARQQLATANRIVITKTDLAAKHDVARLRAVLDHLAPGTHHEGASFGSPDDLPTIASGTMFSLPEFAAKDSDQTTAYQLDLGDTPNWTALTLWLSALLHTRGNQIVRVKGVVNTPSGRLLVQAVRKSVQSPEILPADHTAAIDNQLVLIGKDMDEDALRRSFDELVGGRSGPS